MRWLRRDRSATKLKRPTLDNPMPRLRNEALNLDPAVLGLEPSADLPRVFGGVMDTAYPEAVVTLLTLADGTTSLYTTSEFGIIGGGEHESVARETRGFLVALETHLDELGDDRGTDVPGPGKIIIHALTYSGRRSVEAGEEDLGRGRHPLSPLFHSAHRVIAALRLVSER